MSQGLARASEWLYHGVWAVLVRWFRVPELPPSLPVIAGETIQAFRPAPGFLRYLKFQFWLLLGTINISFLVLWLVILIAVPIVGIVITPIVLAILVIP